MAQLDFNGLVAQLSDIHDLEPLAVGGQKIVYKATHKHHGLVAVKLILNPNADARTQREIEASTRHPFPHMPFLYEHGVVSYAGQETKYLIEQYLPGQTLRKHLEDNRKMSVSKVVRLIEVLLETVMELEKELLVHRDIKPDNIIVGRDDQFWLLDLGIARHLDKSSLTATSAEGGPRTWGYASPEQVHNWKPLIDSRSDLFAIGIVAYETLSGGNPFLEGNPNLVEIIDRVTNLQPPKLELTEDAKGQLAGFINALMAKATNFRPRSGQQALATLHNRVLPSIQSLNRKGPLMQLFIQYGWNMTKLCPELIKRWGGGTVILRPRDLDLEEIEPLSKAIAQQGGLTLFDPVLYNPRATYPKLAQYAYWPSGNYETNSLSDQNYVQALLKEIAILNTSAGTLQHILPGLLCKEVSLGWLSVQRTFIAQSKVIMVDKPRLATICLSSDVLRDTRQILRLLVESEDWDVDGYYLVAQHPNDDYLVDDPNWLTNLLQLCAGLKMSGRTVIVGYCSPQMLYCAAANVDAIASGDWQNVRLFDIQKFDKPEEATNNVTRRAIWYYSPQTLSEYKLPALDLAAGAGVLYKLKAPVRMASSYADVLFGGTLPSGTDYSVGNEARHYLQCLHTQSAEVSQPTFQETLAIQRALLVEADMLVTELKADGIYHRERNIVSVIDTNYAALTRLEKDRGFQLEDYWPESTWPARLPNQPIQGQLDI